MPVSIRTRALTAALPALLTAALAVSAQTESPAARITALQRAGRVAEALVLCRQENAARPGDPVMLYNQACLESRTEDVPAAVRSLRASLAAGFDDFDFALSDPDLQGAAAEGVRLAINEHRQRRGALSRERGAHLTLGRPVVMPLESSDRDPDVDQTARLTVTWQTIGLALRLEADDSGRSYLPEGRARPWLGESGAVVALGDLAGDRTGETTDCFVFGFGMEHDAGVGALFVAETGRWQRVRDLEPKFRGIGTAQMVMDVTIPWSAIVPYHPLVDPELGLNAALLGRDGSQGPRLMPAAILDRPASPHHWAARLDFDLTTATPGVLQGRTPATIVTGDAVALNLVSVSDRAGEGTLTVDFRDSEGQSLLAAGPSAQPVPLNAGVNAVNRAIDFSQLRSGPCRISAALTFPSGAAAEWSAWLLHLEPEWELDYRNTIARLPADEQPTANHYLNAVVEAARIHRARRNPGALTTTIGDLNLMLACFRQTGSLVPAEGLTTFVYPGPGGADRLCHLVVPAGRPSGAALSPVLLAGHTAADAPRLADRILRYFAETKLGPVNLDKSNLDQASARAAAVWPVFVVAPGTTDDGAEPAAARFESPAADKRELLACADWVRKRFGADKLQVAVQRRAVVPGLALASDPDAPVGRLLVFANGALELWPGASTADPALRVGAAPRGLTVTWVDFAMENATAGPANALRDALLGAGWRVETEEVRGGASFTQIADRTCHWQAGAPGRPTSAH